MSRIGPSRRGSGGVPFDAGDDAGARRLLEDALAVVRNDDEQARILYRLASISWMDMRRVSIYVSALSAWPSTISRFSGGS